MLLSSSQKYLEYGSGGSTYKAAEKGIETLSVESDKFFSSAVKRKISGLSHHVHLHYADIGITGPWGVPIETFATKSSKKRYKDYVFSPDQYLEDTFYDTVLIDGRFRVACALYCINRAMKYHAKTLICIDDYAMREAYHVVEKFCKRDSLSGRMAFFKVEKKNLLKLPTEEEILQYCNDYL
ncbi:MAG: hypothetical protein WD595_06820 [Waddliaceae bacterium]